MIQIILNLIKENYKTIIKVIVGLFILYWVLYVLTPKMEMSNVEKQKIDLINIGIEKIYKDQQRIDSNVILNNKKIEEIDVNINNIKGQKTIIKERYDKEIIRVDNYSDSDIDSFFTNRYK
jgi:hypothetical protein